MKRINNFVKIFCLLILTSTTLSAEPNPDISIAEKINPPKIKHIIKPIYPVEAKRSEIEGTVILIATINTDGIPQHIKAETDLGFGLEEAAIEALKKSTFHPANKNGKAINATVKIPYEFKLEDSEYEMVLIPAGEFLMGSINGEADESPVHPVHIDSFYMDRFEVTNAEYKKFVDANPQWRKNQIQRIYHDGYYLSHWNGNEYPPGKDNHPVVYVSWYAAMAYAKWVGKRLPTEAEWEKAARGGLIEKTYAWGDSIDKTKANYYDGTDKDVTPVGIYPSNGYGLYDMTGNVREWCLDVYDADFYTKSPTKNPFSGVISIEEIITDFISIKSNRVIRGGSWLNSATSSRVSNRNWRSPMDTNPNEGFRCVARIFKDNKGSTQYEKR